MIPPNIPLSVVAGIIDILAGENSWEEVKKFSSLSLFCREQCRKRLFANIKVGEDDEDIDDEEGLPPMPSLDKFLSLIQNYPDTAPYVRHLCLVNPLDEDDQAALPHILAKLTNLSSFEIFMFSDSFPTEWSNALSQSLQTLSTIPSLERLNLRGIYEFPLKALAPLAQIQHLELDHVDLVQHRSFKAMSSPPRLLSLTVMDFDEFGSDGKLSCFKMKRKDGKFLLDLSSLKEVQFGPFSGTSLKAASDVFRCHTIKTLEELSIGIEDIDGNYAKHLLDMVIPQQQTLKRLDFFSFYREGKIDPYSKLCTLLDKMAPNNVLATLKIRVNVGLRFDMKVGEEWRTLCNPLTKPGWEHLKLVTLKVPTFDDDIQAELQKLHEYLKPLFSQHFEFKLELSPF